MSHSFANNQVLELLEEQLRRVEQRIDALLLVGGFSGSSYLFKRVEVGFTLSMLFQILPRPYSNVLTDCTSSLALFVYYYQIV